MSSVKLIQEIVTNKGIVNIIGPPGSGKTKLSEFLAQNLKKNILHLDIFLFDEKCNRKDNGAKLINEFLKNKNSLIIDGTYVSCLNEERIDKTDHFIMLDVSFLTCVFRIFKRTLNFQRKKHCAEKLNLRLIKFLLTYHLYKCSEILAKIPKNKLTIINHKYEFFI